MANPNKVFLIGTEAVLNWFDQNAKKPYWSVVDSTGKNILFYYCEDDMHESREHLENNLRAAEQSGQTATFHLRIHPKKPKEGYFTSSSERMINTFFRPNEYETLPYNPNAMQMGNPMLTNQIAALESKINALQMQLESDQEEDDYEEEPEKDFLGSLMGNPAVKQMLVNVVANLLTPQAQQMATNVTHVAGIEQTRERLEDTNELEGDEEEDKIWDAIERLRKVDATLGDDLLRLCQIAENDPKQFNMLLKMLRM